MKRSCRPTCVHSPLRQGGRTYHVPNYAIRFDHAHINPFYISQVDRPTSYANEKSHLISVTFDEDKSARKTTVALVFMFLLFLGYSSSVIQSLQKCFHGFRSSDILEVQEQLKTSIRTAEGTGPSPTGSSGNPRTEHPHLSIADDAQTGSTEMGNFNGLPATTSLYWGDLRGDAHCLAYGIRRYTAPLRNVPFWANRTQACKETAIQINGLGFRPPDRCEVKVCHSAICMAAFATYVCPVAIWSC